MRCAAASHPEVLAVKMPTNEIARSATLYVLVADAAEAPFDYRSVLPDGNVQWGFVQKAETFAAALRLQPWDLIVVDASMVQFIPNDLLAAADIAEEGHNILLVLDADAIEPLQAEGMFDLCGYLLRGPSLRSALARVLRRALYVQSLRTERSYLENEIERILTGWEQSIRDRTRNLERKNQELKAIDELKNQFLENVSHELRTPLALVRSYVELLIDCPPDSAEEQREFLTIIDTETRRLSRMIDDLLDLARINAGSMTWNMREVDLRALLPKVVAQVSPLLARRSIECVLDVPADMPAVQGDADRLSQVFLNLLDNAIKHTQEGRIAITAELVSEPMAGGELQDLARVTVSDTGTGIPEDSLETIFERFTQAGPEGDGSGAGLGLAICREIVNHHSGRIWAEPSDAGARLIVQLPLAGHLDVISGAYTSAEG